MNNSSRIVKYKIPKGRSTSLLIRVNKELAFQNQEKQKRADELILANIELAFQNDEKEKRATELVIANRELSFQNQEKQNRADELALANIELAFQNDEKEKRAAELVLANAELIFQNEEKEKRAAELIIANLELKKAEDNIKKLNEEDIRQLNDVLEKMVIERTTELEVANQELESFSYSVSHDLRAPLRIVSGYATILHEEYHNIFDNEGRRLLSIVQDSAKRMGVLIDDLLAFSRLGRNQITKTDISMNSIVKLAVNQLTGFSGKQITIEIKDILPTFADYSLMNQVWMNLLSNAIKYSAHKTDPVIIISSKQLETEIVYSVADNGVGFDMQYAHKLFGVFQRLHDADEFEGTGVGLALVQRIIKKHGGEIWATAEIGEGAVFSFSLPRTT